MAMRFLPASFACCVLAVASLGACTVDTGSPAKSSGAAHAGWFDGSLDDALKQARASSKLVFVDVFTTWCGPCKRLEQVTFPDPAVKAELGQLVALRIDAESPAGRPVAQRLDVKGYPTMVVLDPSGREVGRIVGFKEPAVFLGLLQDIRDRAKL